MTLTRRRSPSWVRDLTKPQLHMIALHLMQAERKKDLSERQEWLWSALVSELEYRNRRARGRDRCSCMLCIQPLEEF